MARDSDKFDPEAPEEREIGREMVDESAGLGSVVAHLYRGEMDRVTTWRQRLDSTTNWAVTVIAGILAYAFSSADVAHSIILVAMLTGVVFIFIEVRRSQRYDVWRSRVRSMQENLFANALDPADGVEQRDWRRQLSGDYRDPDIRTSLRSALAHRLRRVYLPLLSALLFAWLFRLSGERGSLVQATAISNTPGWIVFGTVVAGCVCLFLIALWPNAAATAETNDAVDRGDLERE